MIFEREQIIEDNFYLAVNENKFFSHIDTKNVSFSDSGLKPEELIDLFESQLISRHADLASRAFRKKGSTYYTIGSCGHEGNAAVAKAFDLRDIAFLHYRSGAFFVQRSKKLNGSTPIYDLMLSFMAAKKDPISGGRHKVIGSFPLNIPPQTSTIASHLPKAVGTAMAITRARRLGFNSKLDYASNVICSFGDASANHSTALAAFNSASWCAYQQLPLPIVFVCEDNGIGISVSTPKNWIDSSFKDRPNIEYIYCDGTNILAAYLASKKAYLSVSKKRHPVFLHMKTVRLLGHAGSDVESLYRSLGDIEDSEANDPIIVTSKIILENSILSKEEVLNLYTTIKKRVCAVAEATTTEPKQNDRYEIAACIKPSVELNIPKKSSDEFFKNRPTYFGSEWNAIKKPQSLAKSINFALTDILAQYPETLVFGEDVAKKGGVYNVTHGLLKRFGAGRVFNTLLDETSILGSAIGYAHNGFIPIPEIQFLAYLHNAEDQLRGEASTLSFFSQNQFTNPMVIRIAGLAYQKGFGGHFHNDNSFAVLRDIPGITIACPSNGADAAKVLRRCVSDAHVYGRISVIIEPIALYMTKDLFTEGDGLWQSVYPDPEEMIDVGDYGSMGQGEDVAILTYGNGYYLSQKSLNDLKQSDQSKIKIFDLMWLNSTNFEKLFSKLIGAKYILIVDECRKTGSFSEMLLALLLEFFQTKMLKLPIIERITADDCFIPLGSAATITLPSSQEIAKKLENAVRMLR